MKNRVCIEVRRKHLLDHLVMVDALKVYQLLLGALLVVFSCFHSVVQIPEAMFWLFKTFFKNIFDVVFLDFVVTQFDLLELNNRSLLVAGSGEWGLHSLLKLLLVTHGVSLKQRLRACGRRGVGRI